MRRPASLDESYTALATADDPPASSIPVARRPGAPPRSRRWERDPANQGFTYRIGRDVAQLIQDAVDEMAADGWACTTSQMARAWLLAGHEQWNRGLVEVDGHEIPVSGGARRKQ